MAEKKPHCVSCLYCGSDDWPAGGCDFDEYVCRLNGKPVSGVFASQCKRYYDFWEAAGKAETLRGKRDVGKS